MNCRRLINNYKKIAFGLLCNQVIGYILELIWGNKVINLRQGLNSYYIPDTGINPVLRCMIFWGFYESAEFRLIKKYLPKNLPVIELGASLGLISSTIVAKLNSKISFKAVEANTNLISTLGKNIRKYNKGNVYTQIINKAISYFSLDGKVKLAISDNHTESNIRKRNDKLVEFLEVEAIELKQIVNESSYTLVCDIEGQEIEILNEEVELLNNCKHLFIELHSTYWNHKLYTVEMLESMITDSLKFILVKRDGNVFYFNKVI